MAKSNQPTYLLPWIVSTGLTQRLVEARTKQDAILAFNKDDPLRVVLSVGEDDIVVRLAIPEEVGDFRQKKVCRHGPAPDQMSFLLDAEPLGQRPRGDDA